MVTFPQVLTFTLLALFVQTVVSNKFIGHGIVIGVFVIVPILFSFGWENTLYLYGNTPPYTYSDMNGYGHFVPALFWSITYWLSISCLLATVSIALARRGADETGAHACVSPRARSAADPGRGVLFLVVAIGSGAWYFYNAHVLNEYLTAEDRRKITPPTSAISRSTNTFRSPRSSRSKPISTFSRNAVLSRPRPLRPAEQDRAAHRPDPHHQSAAVGFGRPFRPSVPRRFDQPARRFTPSISSIRRLRPARNSISLSMSAIPAADSRMATNAPELAYSGTFFDSSYFPTIGYDSGIELGRPSPPPRRASARTGTAAPSRRPRGLRHQSLHAAIRLDQLPHHRQHLRRPDRALPRLSHARMARQRPPLFHLRHGQREDARFLRLCLRRVTTSNAKCIRASPIPSPSRSTTRRSHLRCRRHDRCIQGRPCLLREEFQPLPIPPVPHPRISRAIALSRSPFPIPFLSPKASASSAASKSPPISISLTSSLRMSWVISGGRTS